MNYKAVMVCVRSATTFNRVRVRFRVRVWTKDTAEQRHGPLKPNYKVAVVCVSSATTFDRVRVRFRVRVWTEDMVEHSHGRTSA